MELLPGNAEADLSTAGKNISQWDIVGTAMMRGRLFRRRPPYDGQAAVMRQRQAFCCLQPAAAVLRH